LEAFEAEEQPAVPVPAGAGAGDMNGAIWNGAQEAGAVIVAAQASPEGPADPLREIEGALQALRRAHGEAERESALETLNQATRKLRGLSPRRGDGT